MIVSKRRIVLVAGGTGGHVFPALATGRELLHRGFDVHVYTDTRGKEYSWDQSFQIHTIPSTQMRDSLFNVAKGVFGLISGFFKARSSLKELAPQAVVGFGGYATIATILAAQRLRIPTVIHQGDAMLGRVNRFLAPLVNVIATTFEHTLRIKPSCKKKIVVTGLPLREGLRAQVYEPSQKDFHLLVIGGSQGAKFFGDILPQAVGQLPVNLQSRLEIVHQCRPEFLEEVKTSYKKTKAHVELAQFFDDMPSRYAWSHLILSRAGANSVQEIATSGRPAIFVPYPFATDDHQTSNACAVVRVGGGWCYQQKHLMPEILAQHLQSLMESPEMLKAAALKVQQVAVHGGAENMANVLDKIIQGQDTGRQAA